MDAEDRRGTGASEMRTDDERGVPTVRERDRTMRRRRADQPFDRSRELVRRMDRMRPVVFIVLAIAFLGLLNAGTRYAMVARNSGGLELFGLLRYAAVPAVIALVVRRRQHDALTSAAQLALILLGAEMLELGAMWPIAEGRSVATLMGMSMNDGLSLYAAAIPVGAVVIWGSRHFGDRRDCASRPGAPCRERTRREDAGDEVDRLTG